MGKFEDIKRLSLNCANDWWVSDEAVEFFEWLIKEVERLRERYESRQFPVLGKTGPSSVPWWWVMKHENAAKNQHSGQGVETLAKRGGMSVIELYYAMRDEEFPWHTAEGEWSKMERKALEWIDAQPWLKDENHRLCQEMNRLRDSRTHWRSPVDVDQLRELHIAIEGYKREIEDLKEDKT